MAKRKHGGRPRTPPPLPAVAGAEPTWAEGRDGTRVLVVPTWTAEKAIQHFCGSVLLGGAPAREVLHWVAECLMEINADPNHRARPAFGLESRGRPADDELKSDVLLYVGLARRGGHTLDSAVAAAAKAFHKSPSTIRDITRGMSMHKDTTDSDDQVQRDLLLSLGCPLPPPAPPRKRRRRPRNTPGKK